MSAILIAVIAGLILAGFFFVCLVPLLWKRRNIFGSFLSLLLAVLLTMTVLMLLLVIAGTKGYAALTREELAATVYVTPLGNQQFRAKIVQPDGRDTVFAVAGDELYIDARVLKWKPFANLLGLHTAYRLDRVSGRYIDLKDEAAKVRTLYSLAGPMEPWDIFLLRTRFNFLAPLVDAYYGSATFVPVNTMRALRVLVSTTGLLIRSQ